MNICVNLNSRSQSKAQIWLLSPSFSDLEIDWVGVGRWLHWRPRPGCPRGNLEPGWRWAPGAPGSWRLAPGAPGLSTRCTTFRGADFHPRPHQGLKTLDQETWEGVKCKWRQDSEMDLELQGVSWQSGKDEQTVEWSCSSLQESGKEKNLCRASMLSSNVFTTGWVLANRVAMALQTKLIWVNDKTFLPLWRTVPNLHLVWSAVPWLLVLCSYCKATLFEALSLSTNWPWYDEEFFFGNKWSPRARVS